MTVAARHLSVPIARSPREVYAFVREPTNLPLWAEGLSGSIEEVDGQWFATSPMGRVRVTFAPENPFGVLDHEVVLESGERVLNPMRVVENAGGSELVFTLLRRPEMTDREWEADADAVVRDLRALKDLLEGAAFLAG